MDGKGDDGLLFNVKTNLDILFVRYCSQRSLPMSNKYPGNVPFSSKTPEAALTVGDTKPVMKHLVVSHNISDSSHDKSWTL